MNSIICDACAQLPAPDIRQCDICGAMLCRENARKGQVRRGGGSWEQRIVCKDPFDCMWRAARWVIN